MTKIHVSLRSIVLIYLLLGGWYSVASPIGEASDEAWHYGVIQHLVDTGELPVQQPGVHTPWEQEGSQPPLYYVLMAAVTRAFDTRDAAARLQRNPHAQPGDPSLNANRNLIVHSAAEDFPWRGTTLAIHVLRLISIGLGAITIVCGYVLARCIFPDRPSIPIGTAALIAFNPMFVFISASVNNDNLVIALTSAALVLVVQCWQETGDRLDRSGWLRRAALGVVLGAAALTKISALTLTPVVGLMLTVRHLRRRDWRGWLASGVLLVALMAAMAGWWYARNVQLYGDALGLETMAAVAGSRALSLGDLIPEFDGFRYSYWALFGAVNILTWPAAYAMFDVFTLAALIGFGVWLARGRASRDQRVVLGMLALYGLLVFAGVVRWTMMTPASQGRLMFPAITAISLILWLGWEQILDIGRWPARWRAGVKWAMVAFLLGIAAISPAIYIAPVYARPNPPEAFSANVQRVDVDFGDELRLVGYEVDPRSGADGVARFTLYWRCLRVPDADYSVFVIAYGRDLQEIGKRDAYPQRGLFGTRQCAAGEFVTDAYRLRLSAAAQRPTLIRLQVGLKDRQAQSELQPTANGQPLSSVILIGGKLPPGPPARSPQISTRYRLGESIELIGYDAPRIDQGVITYALYWHVAPDAAKLVDDYTVFAHVLDGAGQPLGQGDGPPLNGDYPTSVWGNGEVIVDERSIPMAAADGARAAEVAVGLYTPSTGARLPVTDETGARRSNDEIRLPVSR